MIFEIWKTWASIGEPVYTGLISTVYNRTAGVKKKLYLLSIINSFSNQYTLCFQIYFYMLITINISNNGESLLSEMPHLVL